MLHTFLSVFGIFLIVYGIEGFGEFANKFLICPFNFNLLVPGVSPDKIFARVNDRFKISCSVPHAAGKLNFYDGDEIVPNVHVKVIKDPPN